MLVLSRKKNESVVINDSITVVVVDIRGDKVRLGIEAPKDVSVFRKEIYDLIQKESAKSNSTSIVEVSSQNSLVLQELQPTSETYASLNPKEHSSLNPKEMPSNQADDKGSIVPDILDKKQTTPPKRERSNENASNDLSNSISSKKKSKRITLEKRSKVKHQNHSSLTTEIDVPVLVAEAASTAVSINSDLTVSLGLKTVKNP